MINPFFYYSGVALWFIIGLAVAIVILWILWQWSIDLGIYGSVKDFIDLLTYGQADVLDFANAHTSEEKMKHWRYWRGRKEQAWRWKVFPMPVYNKAVEMQNTEKAYRYLRRWQWIARSATFAVVAGIILLVVL